MEQRGTRDVGRITGGVMISVADEGPGIPPERVDKVFDRFFTAEHEGPIPASAWPLRASWPTCTAGI